LLSRKLNGIGIKPFKPSMVSGIKPLKPFYGFQFKTNLKWHKPNHFKWYISTRWSVDQIYRFWWSRTNRCTKTTISIL